MITSKSKDLIRSTALCFLALSYAPPAFSHGKSEDLRQQIDSIKNMMGEEISIVRSFNTDQTQGPTLLRITYYCSNYKSPHDQAKECQAKISKNISIWIKLNGVSKFFPMYPMNDGAVITLKPTEHPDLFQWAFRQEQRCYKEYYSGGSRDICEFYSRLNSWDIEMAFLVDEKWDSLDGRNYFVRFEEGYF